MTPANSPITNDAAGLIMTRQGAAIMTPPANVDLNMSSIENFSLKNPVKMQDPNKLPVNATIVFVITLILSVLFGEIESVYTAALNDGQNIQKKRVPIKANRLELIDASGLDFGCTAFPKMQLVTIPK